MHRQLSWLHFYNVTESANSLFLEKGNAMIDAILQWVIGLGGTILVPAILIILGLVVRLKPSRAIQAGLTVAVGMIGVNAIIGILTSALAPAVQAMVENFNLSLNIIDMGSGTAGPLSFSTTLGVLIIPIAIVINLALVWMGLTKTLNVDVWNLWQPAMVGVMVWAVTGDYLLAVCSMVPFFLLELLLADIFQPMISRFFGLPGIAITHVMALAGLVLAVPLNWVFEHIPGIGKIDVSSETIQRRFGFLGNPMFIGFVIGCIIGVLARFDFAGVVNLGLQTAAVLMLLPKMISMFMEGLTPIAEATQQFTEKHLHGADVNIGMDAALTVGNPDVLAVSIVMIPITLFIGVVLPGNQVLPVGDLPTLVFALCLMVAAFRGNFVRSIIGCSIYTVTMLYLATWIAPALTGAYQIAGYAVEGLASFVSAGLWPNALGLAAAQYGGYVGVAVLSVIVLVLLFYVNKVLRRPSNQNV